MFIAVDDTDSMKGNCTTFLATEIIREFSDLDLIGNPRLVRLNPAVPWKTRGNGALVMRFGKGAGKKRLIGRIVSHVNRPTKKHREPCNEKLIRRQIESQQKEKGLLCFEEVF